MDDIPHSPSTVNFPKLNDRLFYPFLASIQPPYLALSKQIKSDKSLNDKTSDADDNLILTEKDIKNLAKKGISEEAIEELTEAVNEQLSSNANADDTDENSEKEAKLTIRDTPIEPVKGSEQHTSKKAQRESVTHDITKDIRREVDKQLKDQQESQYEALKQYLAEKNTQQAIDYRQVRIDIESGSLPTKTFYLLNALAAIIAGFGLLANSPAVVIGAMLVAMLIGPISGIALAIIDARFALLKKSLFTLLSGGVLIFAIGMILGWLNPEQAMSQEIISRTAPNTMDVMVALAGGTAGAYSLISPRLSVAVVGVAVATALVPPLTASGILLANGQYKLALGAFILTLTNILAIQFTNALVLWVAGFRRLDVDESEDEKAKDSLWQQSWLFIRRNVVTLILLIGISIYLTLNFQHRLKQQAYEKSVNQIITDSIAHQPSYITSTSFDVADKSANKDKPNATKSDNYLIRVVLQGIVSPSPAQVQQMEEQIKQLTQSQYPNRKPIRLQVRFVPEQVIESTPVSNDDVKLDNASINQIKDNKN